jgi:hypothetical protein
MAARLLVASVAALLALPATASAQATGDVNVSVDPAVAGKPSRVSVQASGQATSTGQQPPRSISLFVARGFSIEPRAVAELCTDQQANASNCPTESRVATGSAQGEANVPVYGRIPFTATFQAFLAAKQHAGDIAGLVVQAQAGGRGGTRRGRIVPVGGTGPFGVELRFENLDFAQGQQAPPGTTVQLNHFELSVDARRSVRVVRRVKRRVTRRRGRRKIRRVVRRRVVRRRRYYLINNPRTCAGSWPYQVKVGFPTGEQVRDGSVACSSR